MHKLYWGQSFYGCKRLGKGGETTKFSVKMAENRSLNFPKTNQMRQALRWDAPCLSYAACRPFMRRIACLLCEPALLLSLQKDLTQLFR
jgi:hypothetical protein